jgi:propanediol utilization protein
VAITHNFGFDPLRPPGGANGRLTLRVLSGTTEIGTVAVTDPFPSGTTLQRAVPLAGPVTGDLTVRVTIDSPPGGTAEANWVTINTSASLSGTVTPGQILVSQAGVRVQNKTVSVTDFTIDMSGVDQSLRGRVQRGALIIDADNPFNVTGTMVLRMIGGTGEIITPRTIQVQPGRTRQRVEFSRDDLSLILQSNVTIRISGSVSGQDGIVTVRPGQVITIDTHLDLTIEIG